ncbi:MAG: glycosyltransferase [Coriobacteriales bacterium]|nr:glycosyltransferase [Coriobacteriales bacterium]
MSEAPAITFGIIALRRIPELDALIENLVAIEGVEHEVVVGLETPEVAEPIEERDVRGVRWIRIPGGRGLAYNRNRVLDAARGRILVEIDDDCTPQPGWLDALLVPLEAADVDAVAGGIIVPPAGFVGDSISALGFPAGGSAGFETMFVVREDGTTENLSTCNCALKVPVVRELGGFDESLTYGGEDTELAYRLEHAGKRILFAPDARVSHPARTSLLEFGRWFYRRGKAKCQFARKVPVSGYVGKRLSSYGRILKAHATDPKIVLILPLLIASVLLQQAGFVVEYISPTKAAAED